MDDSLVDVEAEHCECDMRTHSECLGSIYRVITAAVLSRGKGWLVMVRAKKRHQLFARASTALIGDFPVSGSPVVRRAGPDIDKYQY